MMDIKRDLFFRYNMGISEFAWHVYCVADDMECTYLAYDRDTALKIVPYVVQGILDEIEV